MAEPSPADQVRERNLSGSGAVFRSWFPTAWRERPIEDGAPGLLTDVPAPGPGVRLRPTVGAPGSGTTKVLRKG